MTTSHEISKFTTLTGRWSVVQELVDKCFPKPPRDVFYRFIEQYREGFPVWFAIADRRVDGIVMLIPTSKGGTLETLAVHPRVQGNGLGAGLVWALLEDVNGVISLTTRIPGFFERFGFQRCGTLSDGSHFMARINPR